MNICNPEIQRASGRPESVKEANPAAALAGALLGMFVITLDAMIVVVALPAISSDLGGGMTGLQWVVDGYTLSFAALLLSAGALADRIGARRAFGIGFGLFVAASIACAMAPSMAVLIVARLVQGAAAALMLPASLSLVREAYAEPAKRARAIAVWAVGGGVAAAAGPVAGGALSMSSWRLIFIINVPVGIVALALLIAVARSPRHRVSLDVIGQCSAVLAMSAVTFGAIEAGAHGFTDARVGTAALVAVVALIIFVVSQAFGRHPMLPLELLRAPNVAICSAAGFAFMAGFFGMIFVLSLYLQQELGLSALDAGLVFLPMTVLAPFVNPAAARLAERWGPRLPIVSGLVAMAAGLVVLAVVVRAGSVSPWGLAVLMLPIGIGGSLAMPPATALLVNSVPARLTGTAGGVFNTSRQLGGALAVAVFGALVAGRSAFVSGLVASMLTAAALVFLAAAAGMFLSSTPVASTRGEAGCFGGVTPDAQAG